MCGIVGYFNPVKEWTDVSRLHQATSLITHRGPDDEGYVFFDSKSSLSQAFSGPDSPELIREQLPLITEATGFSHHVAFGFRRFSIVDLTEKGHQPFWSRDNNICLIFNGEVYNYVEIRQELERLGYSFKTTCDTEVLLVGYQHWGMDVLTRCNGPIALALYDKKKNKLILARDRVGKSPLYYTIHNGVLYWASEIKCILHLAGRTSFDINEQAVYDYLNFGWRDLDNTTFWENIQTLDAASWTCIDLDRPVSYETITKNMKRYWTFPLGRLSPKEIGFQEAVARFRELFLDAVAIRSRADAKVAFTLSGGLDSSSIVAAAANILDHPFRTYSFKFPGEKDCEEYLSRETYKRYPEKIDYHIFTAGKNDFWEVANDYLWLQEEPFHTPGSEFYNAFFRNARTHGYKVMIIGSGGDELLAGYDRYFFPMLMSLRRSKRFIPLLRNLFGSSFVGGHYIDRKKLKILFNLLNDPSSLQSQVSTSFFNSGGQLVTSKYLRNHSFAQVRDRRPEIPLDFNSMMIGYMSNWLMNYWLRNSNRSHFGVPVEPRSPFLDYRLIDYAFTLPPEYLFNRGFTKYILRKSMEDWVPRKIIWDRQKRGAPFNTVTWFRYSKPIIEKHMRSIQENPFVDINALLTDYEKLLYSRPFVLWRCVCMGLWWKRVIQGEML